MRIWVRVMYLYTNPINYSNKNLSMFVKKKIVICRCYFKHRKKVDGAMLTTCEFRWNIGNKKMSVQPRPQIRVSMYCRNIN
jgi:hypothetical protein